MSMKRFVEGEDRRQGVLLPEYLDDYVSSTRTTQLYDRCSDQVSLDEIERVRI